MRYAFLVLFSFLSFSAFAESTLKLAGSTTVASVLEPHQAELESRLGRKILIEPTSSTHGLEALAAGTADIAMLSSSLEEIATNANQKRPGAITIGEYKSVSIGSIKLRFIVNPKNSVRKLSQTQLSDLLTGKTAKWSEIGGPDAPVILVGLANTGGLVREKVTHGADFRKDGHVVNSADQIPTIVAQNVSAVGIISDAHKRGLTSFLDTNVDLSAPLFLVTRGEPSASVTKLAEALKEIALPAP